MSEQLGEGEREILDAEMTLFASGIVSERITAAVEDQKQRGVEDAEPIDLSGNIDGTPYRVVIPPNRKGEE
jgi:hypothetical protein